MKKILKRATPFGIAERGDDLGRLVEEQIDTLARRAKQLAGNLDVVARWISLSAELGDDSAVDSDQARGDEFFGVATGGDSGARDDFLQAFEHAIAVGSVRTGTA